MKMKSHTIPTVTKTALSHVMTTGTMNPETIPLSKVNDGQVDCLFHDDELVDAADNWFGLEIDEELEDYSFTGECQVDGEDTAWPWVFLNDGVEDCDGATDEDDGTGTMTYTCEDGTVISFSAAQRWQR